MKLAYLVVLSTLIAVEVYADSSTLDAAIGGGIGGAAGAAIGNEVGGREGAIVGGAIGGGVGAAVATDDDKHKSAPRSSDSHYRPAYGGHPSGYHCPPGQRKKGRC